MPPHRRYPFGAGIHLPGHFPPCGFLVRNRAKSTVACTTLVNQRGLTGSWPAASAQFQHKGARMPTAARAPGWPPPSERQMETAADNRRSIPARRMRRLGSCFLALPFMGGDDDSCSSLSRAYCPACPTGRKTPTPGSSQSGIHVYEASFFLLLFEPGPHSDGSRRRDSLGARSAYSR